MSLYDDRPEPKTETEHTADESVNVSMAMEFPFTKWVSVTKFVVHGMI